MMRSGLLVFLFFCSLIVQVSLIQAAEPPLALIPFHLAIGMLIMHRGEMAPGVLWMLLTPMASVFVGLTAGGWWSYVIVAILGPILVSRIFAKQSFLALLGLSWTLYVMFIVTSWGTLHEPFSVLWIGLLLLSVTLLVISFIDKRLKRFSRRFIFVSRKRLYARK